MFVLSEEQILFKDSVDRFVEKQSTSTAALKPDPAVWQSLVELGWPSSAFPDDVGGLGGGPTEISIVMEGVGRGLMHEPVLATFITGAALMQCRDNAAAKILLGSILSGEKLAALAFQEHGPRFDPLAQGTIAAIKEKSIIVNGSKTLVLDGDRADEFLVFVHAGEPVLMLVSAKTSGLAIKPCQLIDGRLAADLEFNNIEVPFDHVLARGSAAEAALQSALDYGMLAVCAEALGVATKLFDQTLDYLKTRKQFGATLGSFQALQHRMADMYVACVEARSLVWMAIDAIESDSPQRQHTLSAAKLATLERTSFVARESIQLHGGIGMTSELLVGNGFRRMKTLQMLFGDHDYHLARFMTDTVRGEPVEP